MYAKHNFKTKEKQNIIFRKAVSQRDIEIVYKMGKNWYKDYLAAGDFASKYASITELESAAKQRKLVVVISDNKYAGFAELKVCAGKTIINVVYVLPTFRRKGIAKLLYKHLMNQCGATEIELTFKRVMRRIEYWKSLGFASVKSLEGYYRLCDLCSLSTSAVESRIFSVALNKEDIRSYRNKQGETENITMAPVNLLTLAHF